MKMALNLLKSKMKKSPNPLPSYLPHLRVRTEHSFRYAAGKSAQALECLSSPSAAITDRDGTWGHVKWSALCKEAGKKPIFGIELGVVGDMELREKQPLAYMTFLARNDAGLRELYEFTTLATEKFYYVPRLDYNFLQGISPNVIILSGAHPEWERVPRRLNSFFVDLSPISSPDAPARAKALGYRTVASGDNLYPRAEDRALYEMILMENRQMRIVPGHILSRWEWEGFWPGEEGSLRLAGQLMAECDAVLPIGNLVHPEVAKTLRQMCLDGVRERGLKIEGAYKDRLNRELDLIAEKKFEDYFFVVADMIAWAKERMMVGPARGSSCGSLVCYLLGITDIDPMPFDLLFERFIDINREDYPDIDIDFQDDKRELVFDYLKSKYGSEQVARLGTVNVYKAKSALRDAAKTLLVPEWEVKTLADSIIERSSGDARATFCILDTFEQLEIGKATLARYPELKICGVMEGHASHTGKHAAGILVTAEPVTHFCAIHQKLGVAMIDKKDAEKLNLLKIDALGLRTLSVIADTLAQIGWTAKQLRLHPLDDKKAFALLNDSKFAGIFQFEGYALQLVCKQLRVELFEDVTCLTALARPGPLNSGGTNEFIKRRTGKEPTTYLHPLAKRITSVTYGVVVYQEQVMQIAREIGALSWEDVSELRKAMSRSMGKEFFDGYWAKFWKGAKEKGIKEEDAKAIWEKINTMGSWAFNRSHAVAYGMMSYWCCILKAHFPLEFAAACLRNAKDDEQSVKVLRELKLEGYDYRPYDRRLSRENWSVQEGVLVGGLTAIKGVGDKLAASIIRKRDGGLSLTPREEKLLEEGVTPWDQVFECAELWGHIIRDPQQFGIESQLLVLSDITNDTEGTVLFIAKLSIKNLRDHNEMSSIQKRGGKVMTGQTLYLNMTLEDDTGTINGTINRYHYMEKGKPIVEGKEGEWYLWKGSVGGGFRRVRVDRWKKLTDAQEFMPIVKKLKKSVSSAVDQGHSQGPSEKSPRSKPKSTKTKIRK